MNYLVAINFHSFHDVKFLIQSCKSVILSVEEFKKTKQEKISIIVFDSSPKKHTSEVMSFFSKANIQLEKMQFSVNGENLNYQLEYAKNNDYDIFFRVDGDDLVFKDRFIRQAQLLENNKNIDVCGGGLLYENQLNSKTHTVMPRENPSDFDYMANRYCLHPTFAIRLASLPIDLKYWNKRIEDKKFILDAKKAGLNFVNDQHIYGVYYYHPKSRNSLNVAFTSFRLNARWAINFNPSALFMSVAFLFLNIALPADFLRWLRKGFFRS